MPENIVTILDPSAGNYDNSSYFPTWKGEKYLGKKVEFFLCGIRFTGEVVGTKKYYLCNGIHDILEIELDKERKQVKIQMHRQAVKIIGD
jgi:hypothetical protein